MTTPYDVTVLVGSLRHGRDFLTDAMKAFDAWIELNLAGGTAV